MGLAPWAERGGREERREGGRVRWRMYTCMSCPHGSVHVPQGTSPSERPSQSCTASASSPGTECPGMGLWNRVRHERVRFGSSECGIIIMHDRQWKESMKKGEACIYQKAVQWFCVNS